uniref:Nuclear receptor ROR-beta-like n=1 Tax=Crassostrea virginica TaxID=6565 RepID=A0A8B8ASK9_CRAVI|nr:nuclear receptor ROR-beta-like [Crassostrea virginica]
MQKASNAKKIVSDGLKRSEGKCKKREKYIPSSEPLALPFCRVCGKRASGIHFGVYSCEACKAFFRRYLQRKTAFTCNKGGNCIIDDQKKGLNCSACRLQKCLKTGMSKAGVRIGRYSTAERTNVILEVQKLNASIESTKVQPTSETSTKENGSPPCRDNVPYQSESSTSPPSLVTPLKASQTTSSKDAPILFTDTNTTDSLSPADEKASNKPWDSGIEDSSRSTDSSILEDLQISLDSTDLRSIMSELDMKGSKSSPPADRLELDQEEANQILEQLMKGYQCVQPFSKNLTDEELEDIFKYGLEQYEDKVRLFGKMEYLSLEDYKEIYNKTQIDVDGRKELYSLGRAEWNQYWEEFVKFSRGIVDFSSLPRKDQSALLKATHWDFGMIVDYRAADPEREMFLSYTGKPMSASECCPHTDIDTVKGWAEFCRHLQKLRLNPEEHALILAISMTFQDRCSEPLQAPEKVEEIQNKLIKVLEVQLRKTYPQDGVQRLAKLLNVFVRLREYSKEFDNIMETMSKDDMLIECIPEMLFFL